MISFSNGGPKQARVKYEKWAPGQFSDEVIVTLESPKGILVGIFPKSTVNTVSGTVSASIVAEQADSLLMELPTQTFTTGSKVWFPKESVSFEVQPA